jgi:hypothetical protein
MLEKQSECPVCHAPIYAPARTEAVSQWSMAIVPCSYTCTCHQLLQDKLRAEAELIRSKIMESQDAIG